MGLDFNFILKVHVIRNDGDEVAKHTKALNL